MTHYIAKRYRLGVEHEKSIKSCRKVVKFLFTLNLTVSFHLTRYFLIDGYLQDIWVIYF